MTAQTAEKHGPPTLETSFDEKLAGAFARNGLNTLLLDMKEDLGKLVATTESINKRLGVVEPALWVLEGERQRRIGFQQTVSKYLTNGRAAWLAALAFAGWAATHIPGWPLPKN